MTHDQVVSVIIPVFNRSFCVLDAVQSALDQTHPAVECIVVDDGSTDDSVAVLLDSFSDDPRVRVITREHAGVSAARNLGLRHASGLFVTFLDSDDLMVPHRIQRQLEFLAQGTADAVIGRLDNVLVDASLPDWFRQPPAVANAYCSMSVLLELRHVLAVGGFDEQLELGEDTDLFVRLAEAGLRIARLDETILVRRYFGDNVTYLLRSELKGTVFALVRRHLARGRLQPDGSRPM